MAGTAGERPDENAQEPTAVLPPAAGGDATLFDVARSEPEVATGPPTSVGAGAAEVDATGEWVLDTEEPASTGDDSVSDRTVFDIANSEVEIGGARREPTNERITRQDDPDPLGAPTKKGPHSKETRPLPEPGSEEEAHEDLESKIARKVAAADKGPRIDPFLGQEVGGRFTIVKKIGEGGMGAVYRARQRGMDRDVAVKVLLGDLSRNETVVKRFQLEALAVSKLKSPHSIQIFDFGETPEGQLYIAMEFLEGISLHGALEKERVLSVRRSLRIGQQMLKSLREAHGRGIVHRDLKPDNVFLTTMGEETDYVKVLDFGVAKLQEGDPSAGTVTKTGTIFGTPKYMSPEQARGKHVDHRSDLYAIGIILYEMMTGRVPFDSDSSLGLLIKHIQEAPPHMDEVRPDLVHPQEVRDLVMRLLAKRPEDRPQTAEATLRELEKLEHDLDDIFRNVVTTEEAVAIGLEIATSPKTKIDTRLDAGDAMGLPTAGPFDEDTRGFGEEKVAAPAGARIPFGLLAAGVVLLLGLGASAAVYASIEPLPESWRGLPGLAAEADDLGTVPAMKRDQVYVTIATDPVDAEIWLDGKKLDERPPLTLQRPKSAPAETYTFKKEGYHPLTRTIAFDATAKDTVRLTKIEVEKPAAEVEPAERKVVRKAETPEVKAEVPPEPEKVKETRKPFEFDPKKVKDTKAPFGGGSGSGGKKPSPF